MTTELDLDLTGMTCASCANRVEKKLNRLDGVDATVNFALHRARVAYDPDQADVDDLVDAVRSAGYDAAPAPSPDHGAGAHEMPEHDAADEHSMAAHDHGPTDDAGVTALRNRLLICAALATPVVAIAMVPALQFRNWQWLLLTLASPVAIWGAWPFHRAAWNAARHGTTSMDTLVSVGVLAAYTYSVVARTSFLGVPRTSPPQSAEITPIGTPGKWQAITAAATGANQAVKVTFAVPPSRGKVQSTVAILVNGSAVDTFSASAAGEATQSRTISVPSNGVDYSIQMRVCNEADNCSESNTVSANAYGPIPAPGISLSKDGPTTFQVHVSGDGNGRKINLHVWTDSGRTWDVSTTASNSWDLGQYGVSFSQGDQAHVTVSDTAGRGVPGQANSNGQTADPPPPPPPPTVTVWKGTAGTINNATGSCTSAACAQVGVRLANFGASVSCTFSGSNVGAFWTKSLPANQNGDTGVYFGFLGRTVTVTCGGHTGSVVW